MSQHTPQYLNGIVLQEATCLWPHLFQPRQFQGKGEPRFDVTLLLTPEQKELIRPQIQQLAVGAFPNGEYNRTGAVVTQGVPPEPAFLWPYLPVEAKVKAPKLAELFPGHWVISAKAYQDQPPQIMIPDSQNPGTYIPMPEGQRAQLVFDGAKCYAGVDFATFENGQNTGVRAQINFIVFYGAGEKVAVGARPDANQGMNGINVQMQTPVGMAQAGAAGQGMPVQQAINTGQPAPIQQPAQQQVVTQQPAQQQVDANGNAITPQVDFTV